MGRWDFVADWKLAAKLSAKSIPSPVMSAGTAILQPTFTGHVSTTTEALILFEACLGGQLSHVPRRPHDRERASLIRSGSVFIYEENASGIKRWTDGVTWSPSRILGNFLVYRELDKPFPPGEKKRAMKKNNRRQTRPGEPYNRPGSYSPKTPQSSNFPGSDRQPTDTERSLIGSLIDSYGFKQDGLVKKTMSVTVDGVTHHLVSYYNVSDVLNQRLHTPSHVPALQYIRPRPALVNKQSFRAPVDELDETVEGARDGIHGAYYPRPPGPPQTYMPGPNAYGIQTGYPPVTHPGMHAGYAVGAPMGGSYMQPQIGSQMPPRDGSYSSFTQPQYNRGYAPINGGDTHRPSMPPTPTSSMAPAYPDRTPSQPYAAMYPPGMQARSATAPGSGSMDVRPMNEYNRGSYSVPNVSNPASQLSPGVKYEERGEPQAMQHQSGPMYGSALPSYYPAKSVAPTGQYQPQQSATAWPGSPHPQQTPS